MPGFTPHQTRIVSVSAGNLAVGVFIIVWGAVSLAPVLAQVNGVTIETDGTVSQRRLPLPTNGSGDLQQQMFLMKQLRAMLMGPQTNPESSSTPVDSSRADGLQDRLQGLKDRIPPEMLPLLQNLPPGLIEQTMNDPEIKQQMKQLLEQYSRDRQIPQGSGRQRLPLPESPNRQPAPDAPPDSERQNRAGNSGSSRESPQTRQQPRTEPPNSSRQRPMSEPEPNDTQDQSANQDSSTQKALQRLKELWNQQPNNRDRQIPEPSERRLDSANTPAGSEQTLPTPQRSTNDSAPGARSDEGRSGTDRAAGSKFPDNQQEWDQLLEDLIREQQGDPFGTKSAADENAENDFRSATRNTDGASPRSSGTPSVQEFLEIMKNVVPPTPSTGDPETADEASPESAAEAAEAAAEEVRRKQQDAKEDLQKFGLQQTLRRIVKEAQQDARQETSDADNATDASSGSSAGLSDSMLKAVKGISKDLIEIVKDGKFTFDESDKTTASEARRSQPSGSPPPPTPTQSVLREIRDSTTEFLSDMAAPPAPPAPDRDEAAAPAISDVVAGRSSGQWLAALAVLVLLAGLLFWRMTGIDPARAVAAGGRFLTGDDVRSKADVIRAYHRMALHPNRPTQHWWTHQMVASDIRTTCPEKTYQIQVLTELYELARYLPQDEDLTPEQILEAQAALKRCEA